MNSPNKSRMEKNVGGHTVEKLSLNVIEKKHNISREELLQIVEEVLSAIESRRDTTESIPVTILKFSRLSSLETIVKFLRENRNMSYSSIGKNLSRNPKTLAVTYAVAHRKMPESFSKRLENDTHRIPFTAFSGRLSILECICTYLKSRNHSYADIARMIGKDQRTVWTVCKRAEVKLEGRNGR
ncbi:MAG: hypothetical protein ACP5NW_02910 [Candidatus Woesearchaeota archaeon]